MSNSLSVPVKGEHLPWRLLARGFAALVLMLLALDAWLPDDITVSHVRLTNQPGLPAVNVELPIDLRTYTRDNGNPATYQFAFAFDTSIPVWFKSQGCILSIKVDGATLMDRKSKECQHRFHYRPPQTQVTPHRLEVQITRTAWVNLQALREHIRPLTQLAGLGLAAYLLAVSCMRGGSAWAFHYYACLITLGLCATLLPLQHNYLLGWWKNYAVEPLAIAMCVVAALAGARSRYAVDAIGCVMQWLTHQPPRWMVGGAALFFFLLTACLSQLMFNGVPHIADSHNQYMHAKIMAQGHFYIPSHPLKQFFDFQNTINNDDKYLSNYLPGHIFFLALGTLARVPWLVNPLLGALTVPAIYLLAKEISGRGAAYIAVALALTSPFLVFMSSEFMNHATTLLFSTLFLYGYIRLVNTRRWLFACLAGASIGYVFMTRPQNAVVFALPAAFHALYLSWRERGFFKLALVVVAAFLPFAAFVTYYSYTAYGNVWFLAFARPAHYIASTIAHVSGNTELLPPVYRIANPLIQAHGGIYEDLSRLWAQFQYLHVDLFGWPTSSLLFAFLVFALRMRVPFAGLLLSCCLSQMASLLLIPFSDNIFGPRYLYECISCLIVLTAIGIAGLLPVLERRCAYMPARLLQGAVACFMAGLALMAFFEHDQERYRAFSSNYWEGNYSYYRMIVDNVKKPAVVFMKHYPEYRLMAFTMPPDAASPVIFAQDLGDDNHLLQAYYPGRNAYFVDDEKIVLLPPPAPQR